MDATFKLKGVLDGKAGVRETDAKSPAEGLRDKGGGGSTKGLGSEIG